MTNIWYMVFEIWSTTDNFFVILSQFLPFYPTSNPKNQNFEKKKHLKIPSFYTSETKNHDYMLYCSWDMAHDRSIFLFSFSAIFCPSTPLTPQTMKISKKKEKKRPGDNIILRKSTKNHDHMLYCSWDMARNRCNYYF